MKSSSATNYHKVHNCLTFYIEPLWPTFYVLIFCCVTLQTAVYLTSNDTNINEYRIGKDATRGSFGWNWEQIVEMKMELFQYILHARLLWNTNHKFKGISCVQKHYWWRFKSLFFNFLTLSYEKFYFVMRRLQGIPSTGGVYSDSACGSTNISESLYVSMRSWTSSFRKRTATISRYHAALHETDMSEWKKCLVYRNFWVTSDEFLFMETSSNYCVRSYT